MFTPEQRALLEGKLDRTNVKSRRGANGRAVAYLEAWHIIDMANELRRLRGRLAATEMSRSERLQLMASAQRLEAAIGATRGKLEDAAPIVTTPNPQAHTLASLTGASMDQVETGLVLLVALLVEMGGLGPFITMNLAKVARATKIPATECEGWVVRDRDDGAAGVHWQRR